MRAEIIELLRPEFNAIRLEIGESNHIKTLMERELAAIKQGIVDTNTALNHHALLAGHPGTIRTFDRYDKLIEQGEASAKAFGIADLSLEEKQAFPRLLREAVFGTHLSQKRSNFVSFTSQFVTAFAAATGSVITMLAILRAIGVIS